MTQKGDIYKCAVCGNIVEVLHPGGGTLVCCGHPMVRMDENMTEASGEKHLPEIMKVDGGYQVTVGSGEHPMLDVHYIEWIELVTDRGSIKAFLKPGDKPSALFRTASKVLAVRAYCNLHGLWSSVPE